MITVLLYCYYYYLVTVFKNYLKCNATVKRIPDYFWAMRYSFKPSKKPSNSLLVKKSIAHVEP